MSAKTCCCWGCSASGSKEETLSNCGADDVDGVDVRCWSDADSWRCTNFNLIPSFTSRYLHHSMPNILITISATFHIDNNHFKHQTTGLLRIYEILDNERFGVFHCRWMGTNLGCCDAAAAAAAAAAADVRLRSSERCVRCHGDVPVLHISASAIVIKITLIRNYTSLHCNYQIGNSIIYISRN